MKQAISVSLGSDVRDADAKIELLGQNVELRREGYNGSVERVAARFAELDGKVDALGVGGIDLWLHSATRKYPLNSAYRLIKQVNRTPVVDGSGLAFSRKKVLH